MSYNHFEIDIKLDLAYIYIDMKDNNINMLSSALLSELDLLLDDLSTNDDIKIIIFLSKKNNIFIAGADINEIKSLKSYNDTLSLVKKGQDIISKIENINKITIAVINGAAFGGGLEFALACNYRIAISSNKTKFSLPEVKLGILPAFGGTQRLPKIIGLKESLNMMLTGREIDEKKAKKLSLIDKIINYEFLQDELDNFTLEIKDNEDNKFLAKRNKIKKKRILQEFFTKKIILSFAKKNIAKITKNKYQAPLKILHIVENSYNIIDKKRGYKMEVELFSHLAISPVAKNLIDLFFTIKEISKKSENNDTISEYNDFFNLSAIIGGGVMGSKIAFLFNYNNFKIIIKDLKSEMIAKSLTIITKNYNKLIKKRKITKNKANYKISSILYNDNNYDLVKNANFVIEAASEDIKVKKTIIANLEEKLSSKAIIATNTSSISINKLASDMKYPERFIGFHFFNPADKMKLVEIITHDKLSEDNKNKILFLAKKIGKYPIIVKDGAGFVVNRILIPYINEANFILNDYANLCNSQMNSKSNIKSKIELIDNLCEDFGMPMGPFTLSDIVGLDIGYNVAKILEAEFKDRMKLPLFMNKIIENNFLGQKTKKGFFIYNNNNKKKEINNKIIDIILNNKEKLIDNKVKIKEIDIDIIDRLIFIMINEASRILEDNLVSSSKIIDFAMIMGSGFPPFTGGLLKYADHIGISHIISRLKEFEKKYGARFTPCKYLLNMAKNKENFY